MGILIAIRWLLIAMIYVILKPIQLLFECIWWILFATSPTEYLLKHKIIYDDTEDGKSEYPERAILNIGFIKYCWTNYAYG